MKLPSAPNLKFLHAGYSHIKQEQWSRANPVRMHWRFLWIQKGTVTISDQHHDYCINDKHIVLIPPNTGMRRSSIGDVSCLYFHFSVGFPYDLCCGQIFVYKAAPFQQEIIDYFVQQADSKTRLNDQNYDLHATALILNTLLLLPEDVWPELPSDWRLQKIMKLAQERPEYQWSNPELAKMVNMSTNAFIRLFSKGVGMSPLNYIIDQRLKKACILLQHGDQTLDEIAESCGFCDRYYFSKMFKQHFETSPAKYRLRVRASL